MGRGHPRCFLLTDCTQCCNFVLLFKLQNNLLGTLTRRHSRRKSSNNSTDDSSNSGGTLKRQTSYKTRGSLESMGGRSGSSTPLCVTPNRERASPFGGDRELQILGEREKGSPFGERPPSAGSVRSPLATNSSNMDNMPSCMVCWLCLKKNNKFEIGFQKE